jgi:aminoglycoside 6'-N-acetyltransferase I
MDQLKIITPKQKHYKAWALLRHALWPKEAFEELKSETKIMMRSKRETAFLCVAGEEPVGFVEVRMRDIAEGARTSPVGYLEGWYVKPTFRKKGVGGALVKVAEEWARKKGAKEMGSDTWIKNKRSALIHKKLGYKETDRVVCFLKKL